MPRRPTWEFRKIRGLPLFLQKGRGKNRGLTRQLIPLTGRIIYWQGFTRDPQLRTLKPLNIRREN